MVERADSAQVKTQIPGGIFVGDYLHQLDGKKRLTIPAEWRELIRADDRLFVLPKMKEKCLSVYPSAEMNRRLEELRQMDIPEARKKQLARVLASRSVWIPADTQGRIRVKDELLEYAGITDTVRLVGTFHGFELWHPEGWQQSLAGVDQAGIAQAAEDIGF